MDQFKTLQSGSLILTLIDDGNFEAVRDQFGKFPDADYFLAELAKSYLPQFDQAGRRTKYGFYTLFNHEIAGLSLLGVSSWDHRRGYTGADTLTHMRGRGIAPNSKPILFYLAFEILDLNRVETGCFASNLASKTSIEKTPGFKFEGVLHEYGLNSKGEFEDEYRYAILKKDWQEIRGNYKIQVV